MLRGIKLDFDVQQLLHNACKFRKGSAEEQQLTLGELNDKLDQLSLASDKARLWSSGSVCCIGPQLLWPSNDSCGGLDSTSDRRTYCMRGQVSVLSWLIQHTSSRCMRWIIAIILKDVKV